MSSACRSSRCCVDAKSPVRASFKVLYKWPESDAAFANSIAAVKSHCHELRRIDSFSSVEPRSPAVVDGYSCRQLYLRSYTFTTKKETVPQRTRRCMRKLKDGAAVFPIFSVAAARTVDARSDSKTKKKNKTKSALSSVFHSLLFCAAKVEVAD